MTITVQPYVFFDGNCRQAMEFYAAIFDGKLTIMQFGDSPMDVPPEQATGVMHATLRVGDVEFFASDGMPGTSVETGMRAHLCIGTDSARQGRRYFDALAEGGAITMPFEKQFWGDTYGMLTDRFGVKWMVNASGE